MRGGGAAAGGHVDLVLGQVLLNPGVVGIGGLEAPRVSWSIMDGVEDGDGWIICKRIFDLFYVDFGGAGWCQEKGEEW